MAGDSQFLSHPFPDRHYCVVPPSRCAVLGDVVSPCDNPRIRVGAVPTRNVFLTGHLFLPTGGRGLRATQRHQGRQEAPTQQEGGHGEGGRPQGKITRTLFTPRYSDVK